MVIRCREETKLAYLFSHSLTEGSSRIREWIERIRPLMTLLGHSSSNKFSTTRVAFSGRPMSKKYSVTHMHQHLVAQNIHYRNLKITYTSIILLY